MIHPLYEDNHLLALFKSEGIATQPSGAHHENLQDLAKAWLKEKYQKKGNVFLHAVHRLDTGASGIVLFAKTSKSLSRLNQAMRQGELKKIYQAQIEGKLEGEGTLTSHLLHGEKKAIISKEGKIAILHYRVLSQKNETTFVEVQLVTGRYHQIRAQFSEIGHPIVGDRKYGSRLKHSGLGIALCHVRLELFHPVTRAPLSLQGSSLSFQDLERPVTPPQGF
jgi:23S rRNA pseudouridine1911/1915/1917 synthase